MNVGDSVKVIDENITGRIIELFGNLAIIIDDDSEFNAEGFITSVVYLQTCEAGGSIVLDDKYTYNPVKLSLIEFNGKLTKHEVKKIEKGSRIAMVSGYSIYN